MLPSVNDKVVIGIGEYHEDEPGGVGQSVAWDLLFKAIEICTPEALEDLRDTVQPVYDRGFEEPGPEPRRYVDTGWPDEIDPLWDPLAEPEPYVWEELP